MGLNWAEHTTEIAAPIETCFEAIIDYETFPDWQRAVVDTEILDHDEKGRGKRVHLVVDAKIRKVNYTLDYRYDEPERIEWDFVEGDGINDADGYYLFEKLGDDRTKATYRFGLEVGIPLPGPVARRAHKQTLKASVEDLKKEAERRAAIEGRAPAVAATDDADWTVPAGGSTPVSGLPTDLVDRATTVSRELAGGAVRTGRDVAENVAGAGFGLARRAIGTGVGIAGRAVNRANRVLGRDSDRTDDL